MLRFILVLTFLTSVLAADEKGRETLLKFTDLLNSQTKFHIRGKGTLITEYDQEALKHNYKELYPVISVNMQDKKELYTFTLNAQRDKGFNLKSKYQVHPRLKFDITKRDTQNPGFEVKEERKDKSVTAYSDEKFVHITQSSYKNILQFSRTKNPDLLSNDVLYGFLHDCPILQGLMVKDGLKSLWFAKGNTYTLENSTVHVKTTDKVIFSFEFNKDETLKSLSIDMTAALQASFSLAKVKDEKPVVLKALIIVEFNSWSNNLETADFKLKMPAGKGKLDMEFMINPERHQKSGKSKGFTKIEL